MPVWPPLSVHGPEYLPGGSTLVMWLARPSSVTEKRLRLKVPSALSAADPAAATRVAAPQASSNPVSLAAPLLSRLTVNVSTLQ